MALTGRQSGLTTLAGQMPIRNQELADQQRAARTLQLQQAVAKLTPQQAPTAGQASQMAATAAQQAGQEQVSRAGQMLETAAQVGKLGQQETAIAGAEKIGALQEGARKEELSQLDRLAKLDAKAKTELFDRELTFKKDAANQTFFSERQLADYKRSAAASDEQLKNWANTAQNYHKRNLASLETIYKNLSQIEENNYRVGKQQLDQAARKEIEQLKIDTARRIQSAKNKAANSVTRWQAIGTIGGAAIGSIIPGAGTVAGATLGASVGGALGGMTAAQLEEEV
jgi:hypothetical protein